MKPLQKLLHKPNQIPFQLQAASLCSLATALALMTLTSKHARADEQSDPGSLPTITVNADKISKSLDQVPASVLVIEGADLEDSGITRFEQLEGRVPGLAFQPFGQSGINSPVMRGLTANFNALSTSTLLLVDDVPTLTAQGFENRFIDIDRIEVLRGPQSTLYGRNAEAGVIALYSRPMDNESRSMVSAELGSRNKRATRFALSRPIAQDKLFASVSGEWMGQDGFIRDTFAGGKADDRERYNINLGLRWTPTPDTDITLRYARQQYHDGAAWWGSPKAPRREAASGSPSWNRSVGETFSLNALHTLPSGLRLRSITAYNDFKDRVPQDTDFTPREITWIKRDHHLRTLSQEFRLEGQWGTSSDWLLGLYADKSDNDLDNSSKRPMTPMESIKVGHKADTLAAFTHWNIHFAPAWTLSLGSRMERYKTKIAPERGARQHKDWTQFSPKLALQYEFMKDNQIYASASRGVRNGGFNLLSPSLDIGAFDPEKVWSYELGSKGTALDKRLRYSFAAYFMDVKNMQVLQMPQLGVMYITSAATATSKGLEVNLDYLLRRGWLLQAGLSLNHTRFDRFQDGPANYDGHHNPFAPDLNGFLGVRYDDPRGWYAQAQVVGSDKVYLDAANQFSRNGYGLIHLLAGYRRGNWDLAAYVNNAADKTYDAVGYQNGFVTVYSPPRELGVRLTWRL